MEPKKNKKHKYIMDLLWYLISISSLQEYEEYDAIMFFANNPCQKKVIEL